MSSKDKIKKLINKRKKTNRENRISNKDPRKIVKSYIYKISTLIETSRNGVDFFTTFSSQTNTFIDRINALDSSAKIKIHWFDEHDENTNWKDLKIKAVSINWSKEYLNKNKNSEPHLYFDIGDFIIENMILN